MSRIQLSKQLFIPLIILVLGLIAFALLVKTKPKAKQLATLKKTSTLVQTLAVEPQNYARTIHAQGTTIPAREIELKAEVGGRIVWVNPNLRVGRQFNKGDKLLKIDPRDYELAVEQQQANVSRAQLELQLERGKKAVAEKEWNLLKKTNSNLIRNALALREPQVSTSKISVLAAKSGLRKAQLNLERTTLIAPFNGFVQREYTDIGQLVSPQQPLGKLVGTDAFWVQISIPQDQIQWLTFPDSTSDQLYKGSDALIWQEIGSKRMERKGTLIQLLGDLDPVGRMARVIVSIQSPFDAEKDEENGSTPILLGSYVNVELVGSVTRNLLKIPRSALQKNHHIYVMTSESKLDIRPAKIRWKTRAHAFIDSTIGPRELLVTTPISVPVTGMLLENEASSSAKKREADTFAKGQKE